MAFFGLQERCHRLLQIQAPLIRSKSVAPISKEYRAWRQRFLCDRIRLAISVLMVFLGIVALMNLGLILPALNRSGEQNPNLTSDRILFFLYILAAQELGLLLNWLLLRPPTSLPRIRLAFLGFSASVMLVPQIQHKVIGETILDLVGWIIFFMMQAVLIPVQWRWHLTSQVILLARMLFSLIGLNLDPPSVPDLMQEPIYTLVMVLAVCTFSVSNLGVYLYERLLIQEFELRQQLQLFLHAVSHDLCSPVTGTLMLLKNLHRDEQGQVFLPQPVINQMMDSQERQLQLINSLLEVHSQKIQGIQLQLQPLQLTPFVQELHLVAHQGQANLVVLVPPDLPLVMADPLQLRRVYENMIANALHYNRSIVCISLNAQMRGNWLYCTVSDNGQGMGQRECDRIFDRYSRGIN
ncbi:MAG TPA: HAMP domain-containing sensor histidine kinase, partial [Leptolyngbyaceae cyanobacterium]